MSRGRHQVQSGYWRTVGRGSLPTLLLALGVPVTFLWIDVGVAAHTQTPFSTALVQAPFFGVLASLGGLGLTARIDVSNDGEYLRLVNLFFVYLVPTATIQKIDVTEGLQVVMADGRKIESSAYGDSLMGAILGYRRAKRALARLERIIQVAPSGPSTSGPTSRRAWRQACGPLAIGL